MRLAGTPRPLRGGGLEGGRVMETGTANEEARTRKMQVQHPSQHSGATSSYPFVRGVFWVRSYREVGQKRKGL